MRRGSGSNFFRLRIATLRRSGRNGAMKALRYCIPFAFLALVPLGFVLGGIWSFLPLAALPISVAGLDWFLGEERALGPNPDDVNFRLLPWFYIPLQIAVIVWAAFTISRPGITVLETIGLTLSVALTAGIFGMLAAHEMVHSRRTDERALGLTMLAFVLYMQFRIAHIQGHHWHAATREDSATARRGESVYRFVLRSVAGQLREGWIFETARLRRRGNTVFGPSNRMLQYFAIEAIVLAGFSLLGAKALVFFVVQSTLAISLLEFFNYIAHYGLMRRPLSAERLEPLGSRHSWNSSRRMNNWSLLNMGRHSDHHRFPARHYQCLEVLPGSPELPSGYAGAILLALVPPLWRRTMDPKVDFWMQPDSFDAAAE
jgi:alkane 1-monooxygenase